jgi:hypothetical protein
MWQRAASNPSGRYSASNYGVTCVKQFTWYEFTFHGFFFQKESPPRPPLHNFRVYIYITFPVGRKKNVSTEHILTKSLSGCLKPHSHFLPGIRWVINISLWALKAYPNCNKRHLTTTKERATCATHAAFLLRLWYTMEPTSISLSTSSSQLDKTTAGNNRSVVKLSSLYTGPRFEIAFLSSIPADVTDDTKKKDCCSYTISSLFHHRASCIKYLQNTLFTVLHTSSDFYQLLTDLFQIACIALHRL